MVNNIILQQARIQFHKIFLIVLSSKLKVYDEKIIGREPSERFNQAYIDDLKYEYQRLKNLNIGYVSELMYVNVHMPYWYFNIIDPDGNVLEITGQYEP